MSWNPPISIELILPLLLVAGGIVLFLSWRSGTGVSKGKRTILLALRGVGVLAVIAIFLNPGHWRPLERDQESYWVVMLDRSASMAVKEVGYDETRVVRAETGLSAMESLFDERNLGARAFDFSDRLSESGSGANASANGEGTDLSAAVIDVLEQGAAAGDQIQGVVVISDGRQTAQSEREPLILRSKAFGVPIHAVSVGGAYEAADLDLMVRRRRVVAFPGKQVSVGAELSSRGLPPMKPELELIGPQGEVLETVEVELDADSSEQVEFSVTAPRESGVFTIRLKYSPVGTRATNDTAPVYVQVIESKTRVFIAEGAPYWDSKFLAQLLRLQEHMEVHSVYRISEDRFFRIDSGDQKPAASETDVFPSTADEMNRYDLIVFGKGARHFMTPDRLKLLRSFVSEQGGAVLFARGKSYVGDSEGIDGFEPVEWEKGGISKFRLDPTADGASAGLFGRALPAPDDQIWTALPALRDANRVAKIKPFTRVLAEGKIELSGRDASFPLLMVRRFGQGTTALVNADGLWKWDFYPDAREMGNMYQEYWTQLIQWMITYSEFLPGQDYSIRLAENQVKPGASCEVRISYRGIGMPDPPKVELRTETGDLLKTLTASVDGSKSWQVLFDAPNSGSYRLQLIDATGGTGPDTRISIIEPPAELDQLNPDPEFLKSLAEETGGQFISSTAKEELRKVFTKNENDDASISGGLVWHSAWMKWPVAVMIILIFGMEWFFRRRLGLS